MFLSAEMVQQPSQFSQILYLRTILRYLYLSWAFPFYATKGNIFLLHYIYLYLQMQILKTNSNQLTNADLLLWMRQLSEHKGLKSAPALQAADLFHTKSL